jgi:hypothetical protein
MEMNDTMLIAGISSILAVVLLFLGAFVSGRSGASLTEKTRP